MSKARMDSSRRETALGWETEWIRGDGPVKIVVNTNLCSGHARCAAVAPEIFELDSDGYVGFQEKIVPPGKEKEAQRGVRACPERALRIEE
jgi:ferredoxin